MWVKTQRVSLMVSSLSGKTVIILGFSPDVLINCFFFINISLKQTLNVAEKNEAEVTTLAYLVSINKREEVMFHLKSSYRLNVSMSWEKSNQGYLII